MPLCIIGANGINNKIHNNNTLHNYDYVIAMFKINRVKYSLWYVGAKEYTELTKGANSVKACIYFKYTYMPKQNILSTLQYVECMEIIAIFCMF